MCFAFDLSSKLFLLYNGKREFVCGTATSVSWVSSSSLHTQHISISCGPLKVALTVSHAQLSSMAAVALRGLLCWVLLWLCEHLRVTGHIFGFLTIQRFHSQLNSLTRMLTCSAGPVVWPQPSLDCVCVVIKIYFLFHIHQCAYLRRATQDG